MTISNYSTTDTQNNNTVPNGAPSGMLPSDVIDVFRRLMADQRVQWNNAQWFDYKDGTPDGTASYVSTNQFKITGNDATGHYHVGRRVKVVGGSGTVYGSITAVSYGSGATTVTIDQNLTNEAITAYSSLLSNDDDALPREAIQDIVGAMLTGNTTSAIDVTYQDSDGTIDFEVTAQATENNFSDAYKTKLDGVDAGANNYTHPTGSGNNHIPAGGASGQLLQYSADGTAQWAAPAYVPNSGNSSIAGVKTFTSTTEATSKDNGSVILQGGLAVEKKIYAGGDINTSGAISANGNITAYASSDISLKHSVCVIDEALSKIQKLSGNRFYYRNPSNEFEQGRQYGLIAQEVAQVLPEMVRKDEKGHLKLRQAGFELTALLIEAVKALSEKVRKLEER